MAIMETTLIYSIGFGALFILLILRLPIYHFTKAACPLILELGNFPPIHAIVKFINRLTYEHLIYPTILRRGKYIGRWNRSDTLLLLTYFAINISCILVPLPDIDQVCRRSGTLSVVNLLFVFAAPHLSFLADLLGLSLHSCRRLHASAGSAAFLLAVCHAVFAAVSQGKLDLEKPRDLFALIAIASLCAQLIPLALRHFYYEIALRTHQLLAFVFAYAIWRHVPTEGLFPRIYLYIGAGLFLVTCVTLSLLAFYRNNLGLSRARISYDLHTIKVRVHLRKPLKVKAGQYINLWVPGASLWSFAQTHPFAVTPWSNEPQDHLDLFVEPGRGFTKDLFSLSDYGPTTSIVLFSGPHGKQLPVHEYENIVMMATGFGIAAHLPYLRKLIHDHHNHKSPIRRIHLVWQMKQLDVGIAAEELLNEALAEDKLDGDYILRISLYSESEDICETPFGSRATVYRGKIPLRTVFQTEIAERRPKSRTVISVSADGAFRDDMVALLREFPHSNVNLAHTEYQPL